MTIAYRIKRGYHRLIFRLSASDNKLFLWYCRRIYKPAPGSLAGLINNYARGKGGRINFLQIGACDGIIYDPLHKFIKRDRWQGLMLEPQPQMIHQYLMPLYRSNSGIKIVNAGLDRADGIRILYTIAPSTERWATGLATFNRGVLVEKLRNGSLKRHFRREGIAMPVNPDDGIKECEVKTVSPGTIRDMFGNNPVDILAIDTEGFDYEVIKMLVPAYFRPEIIIYEEVNLSHADIAECRNYLTGQGYRLSTFGKDVVGERG